VCNIAAGDLTAAPLLAGPHTEACSPGIFPIHEFSEVKKSLAARPLLDDTAREEDPPRPDKLQPRPGGAAPGRVDRIGHHHLIETGSDRRLRLYKGDRLMCVFGDRYATDVYEGRVHDVVKLHMLTGSGLVGTVVARHRDVGRPTGLSFLGYLAD